MNIPFPVCNSATLRYTLFAGEVNVNDIFTINPFKDIFYYFTVSGEQIRPVIERLNNPPHQGETVSRSEPSFGEHERAITSARYYYSSLQVRNSTTYDLLCAEYDSSQILSALRALYPTQEWERQTYPTQDNSTSAWMVYIPQEMPCSHSCPCPSLSP